MNFMNILNNDKFTSRLKKVLTQAQNRSIELGKKEVEPEDLLITLAEIKGTMAKEILYKAGWLKEEAKAEELVKERNNFWTKSEIIFSLAARRILEKAVFLAADLAHDYIGTEHLLNSLIQENDQQIDLVLKKYQVDKNKLQEQLQLVFKSGINFGLMSETVEQIGKLLSHKSDDRGWQELINQVEEEINNNEEGIYPLTGESLKKEIKRNKKMGMLDIYAKDLTSTVVQATIDPVIGRQKEINRLIQILLRRTKNNPVLLGDSGVGKTAIVEGLAKQILNGEAPEILLSKKIYALDVNLLIAGAMMRGEFEARLKKIMEEVKNRPEIILFIDELHNIVGAGSATGTLDAANILKPALARGELRCIGATTFNEYKKYIEEDPALERRFQTIKVLEPGLREAEQILQGLKKNYEKHHRIKINNEAISAAVRLSERYLPEKFLPDKAIDLIDEAAAKKRLTTKVVDEQARKLKLLQMKFNDLEQEKENLVRQEKYEEALKIKEKTGLLASELAALEILITKQQEKNIWLGEIKENDIAELISESTGIPVENLIEQKKTRHFNLTKILQENVIGQDKIMAEIAFYLKRAKAGLAGLNRPLASFMFLGPSGVGKTETAKVLAAKFFKTNNEKEALIRLDMSEFAEGFNVARLIGAPAGYIGYKEGGRLTEAVRRQPYSVVLFDEIEKAHPEVFNSLLQILDEGFLTDAAGKRVNFKNTVIILTTNIGNQEFNKAAIGFGADGVNQKQEADKFQKLQEDLKREIKNKFSPEFVDRLDRVFVFEPLSLAAVEKIVILELKKLSERLERHKKINLVWTKKILKPLANWAYTPESGARQVARVIGQKIEEPLAEMIIGAEIEPGQQAVLSWQKNKVEIKVKR